MWSIDTFIPQRGDNPGNELKDLTTLERYQLMARVVEQAWVHMAKNMIANLDRIWDTNAVWLFLFVAPEYFFANSEKSHAIPEADKRNVVGRLAALSAQYTNLILVPGSIAWKKTAVRPLSQLRKKDPYSGTRTGPKKTESREDKFRAAIEWSVANEIAMVESVVQREKQEILSDKYLELEKKKRMTSSDELDRRRRQLVEKAQKRLQDETEQMRKNLENEPTRCFIARNTAYAFFGGSEVARYHKRGNFYEVRQDESDEGYVIFEPGGGPEGNGDQFEVEGVKFGLEICLDHQLGFLSHTSRTKPDVHIILSAAVKLIKEHAFVPKNGFVVHASSEKDHTSVHMNDGRSIVEIDAKEEDAERGSLRYAVLPFQIEEPVFQTLEDFITAI